MPTDGVGWSRSDLRGGLRALRLAAQDRSPVDGLTHLYYRYPARFSPAFTSAAILAFSDPGDVVLDPYMGGGTAIVEALANGRRAVGCDVNELAVFVVRAKTMRPQQSDRAAVSAWAREVVPALSYRDPLSRLDAQVCPSCTRNLNLPRARPIKKLIAAALGSIDELPTPKARHLTRCALLKVGQWALDSRKRSTPLAEFRTRITLSVIEMLRGLDDFQQRLTAHEILGRRLWLINDSAANLAARSPFKDKSQLADLVVTSPPYPGIHMLYHRWQVNGRRETPAPFWIAGCRDGRTSAYYNFYDRKRASDQQYFDVSFDTLKAIRSVVRHGALVIQMLAFGDPKRQLPKYLRNMRAAGFEEIRLDQHLGMSRHRRIWRSVPNRRWHAHLQGKTRSSREVVLIHRSV